MHVDGHPATSKLFGEHLPSRGSDRHQPEPGQGPRQLGQPLGHSVENRFRVAVRSQQQFAVGRPIVDCQVAHGQEFADQVEHIGMGFSSEVEFIKTANELEMFTFAYASNPEEAIRSA